MEDPVRAAKGPELTAERPEFSPVDGPGHEGICSQREADREQGFRSGFYARNISVEPRVSV